MAEVRVSAVMRVRNGERFVGEALASLRGQTHPLHEVVVVDDASTDATPDLLAAERDEAPHPVVVLRNHQHLGNGPSLERGLCAATGDVLMNCDHDDVSDPTRAAAAVEVLGQRDAPAALFTDAFVIDDEGRDRGTLWDRAGAARLGSGVHDPSTLRRAMLRQNISCGATMAVDARLLPRLTPLSADSPDYWIAFIASAAGHLLADARRLLRYRVHSSNISGGVPARNPWQAVQAFRRHPDFFERQRDLFEQLTEHLRSIGADDDVVADAGGKARHLGARTSLSSNRVRRGRQVMGEVRRGGYRHYSPGLRSPIFDLLLAPAGDARTVEER